jgi:general secretion pathway protein C
MKRWPILVSFVLFVGLCVSGTFWAMQLFKPAVRPVAVPKQQAKTAINVEVAESLFGGRPAAVAAASNFQLKGVIVANNALESIAILVADGKPAVEVRANSEATPGVKVKEVHAQYVLLTEGGVVKRVELPAVASPSNLESPLGPPQSAPPATQPSMTNQSVPPPPPPDAEPPKLPPPSARVIGRAAERLNRNN